jgi:hypothetical protein
VEDVALLEALEDRLDLDDARAALAEAQEKGTIPWEKIKGIWGSSWRVLSTTSSSLQEQNAICGLSPLRCSVASSHGLTPWPTTLARGE